MNALANRIPRTLRFSKYEKQYLSTLTGAGFHFFLTPSMINTSFPVDLHVNVNGNGPANLRASGQSLNGDSSGRGVLLASPRSTFSLNPDLMEQNSSLSFSIVDLMSVVVVVVGKDVAKKRHLSFIGFGFKDV